jgi:hypothetical protein
MSGYDGKNVSSSQDTFDYVIVGAGSAGCVLANRLSADPSVRVLLLEAGPPDTLDTIRVPALWSGLFGSEVDWDYRLEPQPHYAGSDLYPRGGKTLGGSSAINAMVYIRAPACMRCGRRRSKEGHEMKALGIAAAAAIALAPFLVVATTPGVAQAAPAPTTVTPVQTSRVVPPSPPPPSTIPVVAADEEPTQPGWHAALRYGVLVIIMSLVAWPLGLSLHRTIDTPPIRPRPEPRRAGRGALAVRSALSFPTIDHQGAEVKRMVLVAAGLRCAVPACRNPTTEIAHIVPESQSHDDLFENLIALCPNCYTRYDQKKEIDRQPIRICKRNLWILNCRYSDFERRVFDQIAETDRRSFIVEAGFEVLLLHAVKDGLLKRVELSPVAIQRGEPTHHNYEVTDAGLNFVSRYIQGEDIS